MMRTHWDYQCNSQQCVCFRIPSVMAIHLLPWLTGYTEVNLTHGRYYINIFAITNIRTFLKNTGLNSFLWNSFVSYLHSQQGYFVGVLSLRSWGPWIKHLSPDWRSILANLFEISWSVSSIEWRTVLLYFMNIHWYSLFELYYQRSISISSPLKLFFSWL